MIKRLFSMLFLSLLFLSACGGMNESESNEIAQENPSETANENYKEYSMKGLKYSVLENWIEDKEISEEDMKYYYPETGILMVSYSEEEGSISNSIARSTFIDGFSDSFESFNLISESETTIGDKPAYQFEADGVLENEELKITVILFNHNDGLMSYIMGTFSNSVENYSSDFENVINSIEYDQEKTQKDEEKEKEEVVEESIVNEIVLGEPIDLGEYTIIIQEYRLAKDYEGNDALIIEYDWMNDSENTTSPFITFNIKGFQDDVETDFAIMVEGADVGTGQKDVKPGGSIEGAQTTVSISDIEKPLELELDELFSFNREPFITEIDLSDLD